MRAPQPDAIRRARAAAVRAWPSTPAAALWQLLRRGKPGAEAEVPALQAEILADDAERA